VARVARKHKAAGDVAVVGRVAVAGKVADEGCRMNVAAEDIDAAAVAAGIAGIDSTLSLGL